MHDNVESQSLSVPLFGLLGSLGHSAFNWYHHFDTSTLFWSLTRLFGFYHRIILSIRSNEDDHSFLESDIESYMIRMRIVLNDTAFIIRQILPNQERGLKSPKGNVHPKDKEMSMMHLFEYIEKKPCKFPEFTEVLEQNKNWIYSLKKQRENIIHYKFKVIVIKNNHDISFAMLDPGGTEETIKTENGGETVVMTPVFEYINSQTLSLHKFLHIDLVSATEQYITKMNMPYTKIGTNPQMTCIGISLFKEINNIK